MRFLIPAANFKIAKPATILPANIKVSLISLNLFTSFSMFFGSIKLPIVLPNAAALGSSSVVIYLTYFLIFSLLNKFLNPSLLAKAFVNASFISPIVLVNA